MGPLLLLSAVITRWAADPACPCIDARELIPPGANRSELLVAITRANPPLYVYPPDYGSTLCDTWDATLEPYCVNADGSSVEAPASYCPKAWCYVDLQACKRSEHDVSRSLRFPELGTLHFSYGTCGSNASLDTYRDSTLLPIVPGSVLDVVIPGMRHPQHFKRHPDGSVARGIGPLYFDASIPWEGSMINYMEALIRTTPWGAINFTHTSEHSLASYPRRAWTAAVHDVGVGAASVAASDFWVTAERASLAQFTSQIGSDRMTLFVPRPRAQTGFWQRAKTIFEPLHWTVWLMLILAPLGMSLVQQFLLNVIADDDQPAWSYVQAAWERRISWSTAITEASREVVKTFGVNALLLLGRDEAFPRSPALLILADRLGLLHFGCNDCIYCKSDGVHHA